MQSFKEPYQIFFPLGIIFGIIGVGLWAHFGFMQTGATPSLLHSNLMIGGFLFTMALGFLMTAIPRFTGSSSATWLEKGVLFLLVIGLFLSVFLQMQKGFYRFFGTEILWLLFFGLRRIVRGTFTPPPPFSLVGLGLITTFAACFYLSFENGGEPNLKLLMIRLISYGLPQFLILGVGSQLLPNILGTLHQPGAAPKLPGTPFSKPPLSKKQFLILRRPSNHALQGAVSIGRSVSTLSIPRPLGRGIVEGLIFLGYGIVLIASFILEIFLDFRTGLLLRALLITFILLFHWRFYKLPPRGVILTWGLWISSWLLALSQWLTAFFPAYATHMAHLFFIGSVSLMIFFVTTRVTISHGGYDRSLEKSSKILVAVMVLILLATLTRIVAPFSKSYFPHLAYASIAWLAAVFLWLLLFLKKIFKLQQKS